MRMCEVLLLVYLTVSEHLLSVAGRRATLETESGHGGIKAVTDLIYSPPKRQTYRFKEGRKCHKPYFKEDTNGMCIFYLCDHMRNRRKIESYKNFLVSKGALREKDFLKGTAKYMHRAHQVALKGAKLRCPWAETIGDEFAEWAEELLPGTYGCIRKAMEIQAGKTRSKCKEGFTREFEGRLRKSCSAQFDKPQQEMHKSKKRWTRAVVGGAGAVIGLAVLPSVFGGFGVAGLAAVAIALQVCKKVAVEEPGWDTREMFAEKRANAIENGNVEDAASWSSLPGPARGGGDESDDELDFRLQEPEETAVGLEEVEREIAEEEEEENLLGLGDDGADASDFADFLPTSGSDPAASDGSGEDWWTGLVVDPPQPESEPSPQSGGVFLGDLMAPTPAEPAVPTAAWPPRYVDPMSLYGTAAATNPFLQPDFLGGQAPPPLAYTFPMNSHNQPYPAIAVSATNPFLQPSGVWRQPAEGLGFTGPAYSSQNPPRMVQPAAPPPENSGWSFAAVPSETRKTKGEDLFADLVW